MSEALIVLKKFTTKSRASGDITTYLSNEGLGERGHGLCEEGGGRAGMQTLRKWEDCSPTATHVWKNASGGAPCAF